jgi:hypothetical protein
MRKKKGLVRDSMRTFAAGSTQRKCLANKVPLYASRMAQEWHKIFGYPG